MDENKSNVLPIIGAVILVVGLGFAGYYLGRYLDIKEMEKKAAELSQLSVETKSFSSSSLGISFDYPEAWSAVENTSGDVKTIKVTSENGSELIYTKDTTEDKPESFLCNSADKLGDEEGTESCEFFTGNGYNYARFEDLAKDPDGNILNIAELRDDEASNWYKYIPSDGIVFKIEDDKDIALLDGIMMTVERTELEE